MADVPQLPRPSELPKSPSRPVQTFVQFRKSIIIYDILQAPSALVFGPKYLHNKAFEYGDDTIYIDSKVKNAVQTFFRLQGGEVRGTTLSQWLARPRRRFPTTVNHSGVDQNLESHGNGKRRKIGAAKSTT